MPSISVTVPHELEQEEATSRLKRSFDTIYQSYQQHVSDVVQDWTDNVLNYSFKTFGFSVKGKLDVKPSEVTVDASLPLAAVMFKGTIESQIREKLGKLLA